MSFLKSGYMTQAVNALDSGGWGTIGAGVGAGIGMGIGTVSDDTSMLGGAFKGAIAGGIAGRLGMYGSGIKGIRSKMTGLNLDEVKFGSFMKATSGGVGARPVEDLTSKTGWTKAWYNQ